MTWEGFRKNLSFYLIFKGLKVPLMLIGGMLRRQKYPNLTVQA